MPREGWRVIAAGLACASLSLLGACSEAAPTIAGVWSPDDGSGTKTISDDGNCTGMYYSNGQPLDIGGGMRCTLGSEESDGQYALVVEQPPNRVTYEASFPDEDTMELSQSGEVVVTLTRR
jgi:uncharacterized protein (DUF2147 family)